MKRLTPVTVFAIIFVLLSIHTHATAPPSSSADASQEKPHPKQAAPAKPKRSRDDVFAEIKDDPKLPRVLLIGDSISMGYTLPVRKMLAGKANVHRVRENAGNTARGLAKLDAWLGEKPWEVIHFNFGLHDLKRMKDGRLDMKGTRVRSPEEYAQNLETLVLRLKKTGATLVWATTTPVPPGASGRQHGDEVIFNEAAAKIMKKHGVRVNDLYGYIMPRLARAQRPRNVHFTVTGSKMLGRRVAESISAALRDREKAKSTAVNKP